MGGKGRWWQWPMCRWRSNGPGVRGMTGVDFCGGLCAVWDCVSVEVAGGVNLCGALWHGWGLVWDGGGIRIFATPYVLFGYSRCTIFVEDN